MYNIVAAIFEVESEGYQALTTLSKTPVIEETTILQMALVKCENGALKVLDSFDSGIHSTNDTLMGGAIGGLIGILGGPIGMILMGSYGAMVGSVIDASDAVDTAALIEKVAAKLQEGECALIALTDEADDAILDAKLSQFKTVIARFDAAAVVQEVEEARKVQAEIDRQARMQLRATKKEEVKAALEDKRSKLAEEFNAFKQKFAKE